MGTQNFSALTFLAGAWLAATPAARGRAVALLGADPTAIAGAAATMAGGATTGVFAFNFRG